MDDSYPAPRWWQDHASLDAGARAALHARAAADPDGFWLERAGDLDWVAPPTRAGDWSFAAADFRVEWFADGVLNAAVNCLDRHLADRGDQPALIWEPDAEGEEPRRFSYHELHAAVVRFARVLRAAGARRGDRVTLYLPMIPEAVFAMLACARIGSIHSVVFGGFSPEALAGRVADCGSTLVITADEGRRGGKRVPLKANVDAALADMAGVAVVVVRATGAAVPMQAGRDRWAHELAEAGGDDPAPEPMGAEDPLFILYTSGSTGSPKGVVHTTAGYLLWASWTFRLAFDPRPGEVFWCAADVGWVTGHSYLVYGPLAAGHTTLMHEGLPNWPDPARVWRVVDRHRVATLFTAPTALRALMAHGDAPVQTTSRASLRLLGSVGEPINPEAWRWYHDVVGEGRCPIIDAWWQTETGGIMIAPTPATPLKPGSATLPMPGVRPALVDEAGRVLAGAAQGDLVITHSWPGQMRGVWGDPDRYLRTYFTTYPGRYFTGDGCRRDADGYYWITGRVDDVINVSGHRLGTAEVESALVLHPAVAEAAVVGVPHAVKGQGIYAFVTLNADQPGSPALAAALRDHVRRAIGPIATPDAVQLAPGLPKTRSGKIMRRILRRIAGGDTADLGDTSTLADPAVVDALVAGRVG